MKTSYKILFALLLVLPLVSLAQQKGGQKKPASTATQNSNGDCFKEWYTLFRDRGGKPVTDGTHDAILTLRNTSEGTSKCYVGRVEVSGGKIKTPILVQKEDGTYDTFGALSGKQLDPAFEKSISPDDLFSINDAMSINFKMSDMEYGRIFFYTFLNDKPKALKQAPSPKALVKN